MFRYIKTFVLKSINGWQNRFLNYAGKETLIKSVAMAMPVFSMTCFKLPMEICSEIDSLLSSFWWGQTNGKRKMSWISWKKLTRSKAEGGLGFWDLHKFNQSLLANQFWKIMHRPNSLLFCVLQHRYFEELQYGMRNLDGKLLMVGNLCYLDQSYLNKGYNME